MLCPVVLTGMSSASVFVQVCVLLMSQRMVARSSGVEYCRISCHVVKMKFGEIYCVPAVGELFVPTYAMGGPR